MTITSTFQDPIAIGIIGTVQGSLDLANGHVLRGAQAVFLGMTSTNLGGRFQGLDPKSHSSLMKYTLGAGIGAVAVQGALRFGYGVKQKSVEEIFKGSIQTAIGIAGISFVSSLDSKIIFIAQQASIIALSSAFIAKLGFSDFAKGRYSLALCKLLLGIGGMVGAGYYIYSSSTHKDIVSADQISFFKTYQSEIEKMCENNNPLEERTLESDVSRTQTLSAEQIYFLETHKEEIEEIYVTKKPLGNWTVLGKGCSKKAFEHLDLPEMVMKIPINDDKGFRGASGEDDLRMHHTNLQEFKSLANSFDRIVVPQSHLYQTSKGIIIVEQKLKLVSLYEDSWSFELEENLEEPLNQLSQFQEISGICDLSPKWANNAGRIAHSDPIKIGIIDFDCRLTKKNINLNRGDAKNWDWNFKNSNSQFFIRENANQVSALIFGVGIAVVGGITLVAKKISDLNPKTILQLGFGVGAIAATISLSSDGLFQPKATLAITGSAMTATAVITIVATNAWSWVKRYLARAPTAFA